MHIAPFGSLSTKKQAVLEDGFYLDFFHLNLYRVAYQMSLVLTVCVFPTDGLGTNIRETIHSDALQGCITS